MYRTDAYSRTLIDSLPMSPWAPSPKPPEKVLTEREIRALATAQRNREGAAARKKREREKLKATRVNPESHVCKPHTPNSTMARR